MIQGKKIAIIGGGPGGLTLARLLQLKGASVKVYERDQNKEARIQGGALDLHKESGLKALEKAGLMEAFKTSYRPGAELVRVVDSQAKIHSDQHMAEATEKFGDKHYRPEIDRGPLRDMLLNSLLPDTVVWNSKFLSMKKTVDSWEIFFDNGTSVVADIVVGADGSNSKIRPYVTDIKPIWTGITMIEGSIKNAEKSSPKIHQLLKGGKIFAYGNGQTLIVSSKGDGSFGFATSCATSEFWYKDSGIDFKDHTQVLAWFKEAFAGWDVFWHELFEDENTLFIPRPQYCMPLNQKWDAQPGITLLGDAAHWMPPFAGEGVNMAMLDALELSEKLTDPTGNDLKTAIAAYEKAMLKRFAKIGQMTLFNTDWMHKPDALKNMLAMFSSNLIKQSAFISRYAIAVILIPFVRKTLGLATQYNRLTRR